MNFPCTRSRVHNHTLTHTHTHTHTHSHIYVYAHNYTHRFTHCTHRRFFTQKVTKEKIINCYMTYYIVTRVQNNLTEMYPGKVTQHHSFVHRIK